MIGFEGEARNTRTVCASVIVGRLGVVPRPNPVEPGETHPPLHAQLFKYEEMSSYVGASVRKQSTEGCCCSKPEWVAALTLTKT